MKRLTAKTVATLRSARDYPGLGRFLLGRVFYTDSVNTVIMMMVLFTVNVRLPLTERTKRQGKLRVGWIMLFAIVFAIAGGLPGGGWSIESGLRRRLTLFCLPLIVVCLFFWR